MTDTVERVRRYAERYFQRSGQTEFPTVRQEAHALKMRVGEVEQAVDDSDGTMAPSYGHFAEVYDPEPAP